MSRIEIPKITAQTIDHLFSLRKILVPVNFLDTNSLIIKTKPKLKNVPSKFGSRKVEKRRNLWGSYPNSARYKNVIFDKLFEEARGMKTQKDAYDSFVKAEQVLMNDAPVMVLWYEEAYRLMQATVKNFYGNAMRYRNYSEVHKVTSSPN